MRVWRSPTIDLVEWCSTGADDHIVETLKHAAPDYEVACALPRQWHPNVHDLTDSDFDNAATEIYATALGREIAGRVGVFDDLRLPFSRSCWFERRFVAAARGLQRAAQQRQSVLAPELLSFLKSDAVSVSDANVLRSRDIATALVTAFGYPVPAQCFSPQELAAFEGQRTASASGVELLIPRTRLNFAIAAGPDRSLIDQLYRKLRERWPREGWGYLQRIALLLSANPSAVELEDAFEMAFIGLTPCWPDGLYFEYALAAAKAHAARQGDGVQLLTLARVATTRLLGKRALELLLAIAPEEVALASRARFCLEVANLAAQQKAPDMLARAEQLVSQGLALAEGDNLLVARLMNVLGLVRYHQGRGLEALDLERGAIAVTAASPDPACQAWSATALWPNIAKLFESRLGERGAALDAYLAAATCNLDEGAITGHLNAARLLIQDGSNLQAVQLLRSIPEDHLLGVAEETCVHILLGTALVGHGDVSGAKQEYEHALRTLSPFPENDATRRISQIVSRLDHSRDVTRAITGEASRSSNE